MRVGATPSLVTSNCTGELFCGPTVTTRREPRGARGLPSAANRLICKSGVPFTPSASPWSGGKRMANNRAPLAGTSAVSTWVVWAGALIGSMRRFSRVCWAAAYQSWR